jgi:AcrR family transcriptional regulator
MHKDQPFISIHFDSRGDSERPERRDAVENRQRVLAAAKQLFAEYGVANVHMAQIAEAAGVGKGTLYRRFANKAELCLALLHDQLEAHQESVLDQMRRLHIEEEPYLDRLQFFLQQVVAFTEQHVPLLREVQREGITSDDRDAPFLQWQRMTVQGLLRAAAKTGEVAPDMDLEVVVDLLLAPLTASFLDYLRQEQGYSTERIGRALSDLVARLKA